jgi:putative membrane protein insertion efficiency factor
MKTLILGLLSIYRIAVSPLVPATCRFIPSCSAYAVEAMGRHGLLAGTRLALARVLRCRPGGGQGFDPVPEPPGAEARKGS